MDTNPALDHLAAYHAEPTPEKLNAVVGALKPTIDYALSSINAGDDPFLRAKAKLITAKAVQAFNPEAGAGLPTWVSGQLMQLRRIRRQTQSPVRVPEGIQLDAVTLMRAEHDFMDKHDREPDLHELADFSKLPVRRIHQIRSTFRKMPSQAAAGGASQQVEPDYSTEAMDYVYRDADYLDRKIMELKTGYGGNDPLSPKLVAQKLKLTPTQLSRRSAKLAWKVQQIDKSLQEV